MNEQDKTAMLSIKLAPTRLEEFRIAAMLRGTTMSSLILQFVVAVVEEEMAAVPDAFQRRSDHRTTNNFIDLIDPQNN